MRETIARLYEMIKECWVKDRHEVDIIGEDGYGFCLRCGRLIKCYEY